MFKINGLSWHIVFVHPSHPMLHRSDGSLTIGSCDNSTQTIYLSDALKGTMLKKVLCHELTHAAMFSYGVKLTLKQEELLADLLATYGDEIISMTDKIFNKIKGGYYL